MTPDPRKILLNLITEYTQSLDRVQGEKELMKCIEARAVTECGIGPKVFKTVATAHWKDQVKQVCNDLDAQLAVFELVRNDDDDEDDDEEES